VDAQSQFTALQQRIEGLAAAGNAQSVECRFQHYFYNLVDPAQVNLYGRAPNATNEALWQKAVRENPDPTCLVPVVAIGFDDLRQRVEAQSQQAASHQEKLKELKTRIEGLAQRHAISNSSRLSRASTTQTQITHRLLKLIQHLHLLIPALRSSAIRPEEDALRVRLEEIEEQVRRGRLRGKLNELWAIVGALLNGARGREGINGTEWAVVDEEGLAQIGQILAEQQAGLQHLTKILQRDLKDLAVIQGKSGEEDAGEDMVFSTTVRATR
jgi:nuclear pore complex protein Nup54